MSKVLDTIRKGMDGFAWVDLLADLGLSGTRADLGAKMLRGVYPNRKSLWDSKVWSLGDEMFIVGIVDMLSEMAVTPEDNVLTVGQAKAALKTAEEREKAARDHKARASQETAKQKSA